MPGLWFPDLQSFDWCLEIRRAVAVLTAGHEDDPEIVRDHFAERLGSSRFVFLPREMFAAVAQTEEEIDRFRDEAEALIEERNLALIATVYRREKRMWLVVDAPILTASDAEIEAELAVLRELHPNDEDTVAAFLTGTAFRGELPILLVLHSENGDWQFLDGSNVTADGVAVHLGHVFEEHPELQLLEDLPLGWAAERSSEGAEWERYPWPDDPE